MTKSIRDRVPGRLQPFVSFVQRTWAECNEDDVGGLSAELAYRSFLALFPFFIFAAALGGLIAHLAGVDDPTSWTLDTLGDSLPADAASIVSGQVRGLVRHPNAGLLSIGALGALWAASAGAATFLKAVNRCHDLPETRGWLERTGLALALTAGAGGGLVLGIGALLALQLGAQDIADAIGAGGGLEVVLGIIRWPIALLFLVLALAFVYWLAPNKRERIRLVSPGILFAAIAIVLISGGLGYYVSNFGSYNKTYGALGGVVVLMLWFYLVSYVVLVGVKVDLVAHGQPDRAAAASTPASPANARPPLPERDGRARGIPFVGYAILGALVAAGVLSARKDA